MRLMYSSSLEVQKEKKIKIINSYTAENVAISAKVQF